MLGYASAVIALAFIDMEVTIILDTCTCRLYPQGPSTEVRGGAGLAIVHITSKAGNEKCATECT
jgi:hypothetical protein